MLHDDTLSQVLYIDLSKKEWHVENREDLFNKYLGGTGVATQLLLENCPEGADPLGPDNPIILAVGPLTGMFPLASKTVAMFKSPHTGNLGESHCGGRTAIAIRNAGYGALVIKGKSDIPVYLSISDGKVWFKNATTLWGIDNVDSVGRILREAEKGAGIRTIMKIGRAGENLVSYACVSAETYRHFGRLGLGAVFGSKYLKAITLSGRRSVGMDDPKKYMNVYDEIYKAATESPVMKKYHELGTSENVLPLNKLGGLPTRNVQSGTFEGASEISGEHFAEKYLGRRIACAHCPVGCIHLAALREPYGDDEPYFYKTSMVCYDYEPIFSLGSMLGGTDMQGILKLMDEIEAEGFDTMSGGVVLAWMTEAFQKGIINETHTDGLKPEWNNYPVYIKIVEKLVLQPNEFYKDLGRGIEFASQKYGGADFAMSFGGNEMPGYHTGPGAYAGYILGARHSHLDNGGYSIDQKDLINGKIQAETLAKKIIDDEKWRQILSSLTICFFARNLYKEDVIIRALDCMGFTVTKEDLARIAEETYRDKFRFKFREGFSLDEYRIPKRIYETNTPTGMIDEAYLKETIAKAKDMIMKLL